MDKYQHRRHNKNLLMVHLIFVTKYRKRYYLGILIMMSNNIFLTYAKKGIGI